MVLSFLLSPFTNRASKVADLGQALVNMSTVITRRKTPSPPHPTDFPPAEYFPETPPSSTTMEPVRRFSTSATLFEHKNFSLKALLDVESKSDLANAISHHGGKTNSSDTITEETTHFLVESTVDLMAVLLDTQNEDNVALTEMIQDALVRHIPVITDTYIWQCILSKENLDISPFEVVRLDKDGQFVISRNRPNIKRSASEPTATIGEVGRPPKPQARLQIRTSSRRPSMRRFHSYHPGSSASGRTSPTNSSGDEGAEGSRRLSTSRRRLSGMSSAAPSPRASIVTSKLGSSIKLPATSNAPKNSASSSPSASTPSLQSQDSHDQGSNDSLARRRVPKPTGTTSPSSTPRVYIYSPKADKTKFIQGLPATPGPLVKPVNEPLKHPLHHHHTGSGSVRGLPANPMRKRSHLNQSFNAAGVEDGVSPGDSDTGKIASDGVVPPPIPARPVLEQQQQQRPGLDHRVSHHRSGSLRAAVAANTSSLPAPPPAVDSPAAATLIKERTHWQTMLASVLTGEVIRSEKRRITGTVTQKQQLDQKYQIWLGIRAYLRGRSVPEERQRIDERRVDAENSINELMHFEVQTLPPPNSAAATSTTGNGGSQSSSSSGSDKSPYDQVVEILAKIDKVESLYPTRKALVLDKPIYAGLPFQHKHEALSSWLTISNSLRLQLQVLKNWTGSEDLLTSRTQHPLSPDKRIDTSFIERILKESGVKRTFLEIRIMSVLRGLLAKCKASMIENASAFKKMQLPTYINELQQLASFPSNLMEEILKYQLEYTEKQAKLKGVMLDHIEEFAVSLSLAIRIKHECQELDQQAQGWSITNSLSPSYDMMLLKSLRYYFTLLNWRLRSSTDTVFFKEAEMLENEWNFMSTICFYIDGGDVETAVQFCELEAELLGKVHTYLDNSLRGVVGDGIADSAGGFSNVPLTGSGLVRWYARMLDNVRSREKKLLKFQKTLTKEFENSSEYTIADPYPVLLKSLLQTGHALVRTDAYANQGVYIFASSSLSTRPEAVAKLLRASFAKYDNFHEAIGEGYVLILSPKDRLRTAGMNWQGRSMQVRLGKGTRPIQLKNERIRLVADTSERLEVCKAIFEGSITCKTTCVKARRAHIEPIHEALKKVKKRLVKLAEGVLSSVQTVRSNLSRMTAGGGSPGLMMNGSTSSLNGVGGGTSSPTSLGTPPTSADTVISAADLVEDLFDFASDFGCRALKYVGAGHKHGLMMKRLVGLAVDWVDFCASDCQVGGSPPVIQQKAFKWSLLALQFAMTATSGGQVYSLTDADFCELRMGVARCMRVLIRGFEQGGGSNGSGSGSQVEEMLTQALKGGAGVGSKLQIPAGAIKQPAKVAAETPVSPGADDKTASSVPENTATSEDTKPTADPSTSPSSTTATTAALSPISTDLPRKEISALRSASDSDDSDDSLEEVDGADPKPGSGSPKSVKSSNGGKSSPRSKGRRKSVTGSEKAKPAIPEITVDAAANQSTPDTTPKTPSLSPSKSKLAPDAKPDPKPPSPTPKASSTTTGSRYTSTSDTSLQRRQKLWLAKIEKLEEERMQRQQANRIVGKVLDTRNVVERNISFLASTSSSISLRWQQGKFLGGGSFGSVYMAINLETADLMAVKEIRFKDVTSIEALQRSIKDEMNVLQLLHHPNIIEYYGVEVHRDKLYIFMEYCPHSVASLLEHGGRFGDEMVVKVYAKQMLKGLEYLHGKGIVHRDVKPANTLLGQEGDIKFVDFGASKIYKSQKTVVVNGETNTLVGTPHYIAPEVITSEPLGRHGAQDIWSMGCCVLEMITGRKPWSGLDNEWAVMYHIGMSNRIPPLPEASTCSEAGIDFLRQCFTRPAAERPTAKELLQHDWVREVDETNLEAAAALLDPYKEAAENARARAALAQGSGDDGSHGDMLGHHSGGLSGLGSSSSIASSNGSRNGTQMNTGGMGLLPGNSQSQPVFFPVRSPGHDSASSASDGTTSSSAVTSETSESSDSNSIKTSAAAKKTPAAPPTTSAEPASDSYFPTLPGTAVTSTVKAPTANSQTSSSPIPPTPTTTIGPITTSITTQPAVTQSAVVRAVLAGVNPGDFPSPIEHPTSPSSSTSTTTPASTPEGELAWRGALMRAVAIAGGESVPGHLADP